MSADKARKRRQPGDGKAAEEKTQAAKDKKAVEDIEVKALLALMQIVKRPDKTLRPGLPFHKLRGPLQAIVNEPRKFGLTPGIPANNAEEELRRLLTAGFVKGIHVGIHDQGGQEARVPEA
jgi:hypothetical protein